MKKRIIAAAIGLFVLATSTAEAANGRNALLGGLGPMHAPQRAATKTVGLKLLKVWDVNNLEYRANVNAPQETPFLLPGAQTTVTCPPGMKCLIEVHVDSMWSIQTAATYGDPDGSGLIQSTSHYITQVVGVDGQIVAGDFASSPQAGDDRQIVTMGSVAVPAGKHVVKVIIATDAVPQFLWDYAVEIRLYQR